MILYEIIKRRIFYLSRYLTKVIANKAIFNFMDILK